MERFYKKPDDWGLVIDPDFRDLLPHDPEREKLLEGQIMEDGCRDALVVWRSTGVVVDGNTRYNICKRNDIPFMVSFKDFESKSEAMQWALENQWSRRNLTIPQRIEAAAKIEGVIRAEAELRMKAGKTLDPVLNSAQGGKGKSRDKLADAANVGHQTYSRGVKILNDAPDEIRDAWQREEISTNAAYNFMQLDEGKKQEAIAQIEAGEPVKKVVKSTQRRNQGNQIGWTKEDRKNRAETVDISSEMRNTDIVPDYDIDMLLEEIRINGKNFVDMMGGILHDHEDLVTIESKSAVATAIDEYILNDLNEMRRSIA